MDGFNQKKVYDETDPDANRLLLLEKRRLYRQAYRKAKKDKAKGITPDDDPQDLEGYQLLQDMLWVYRQMGGRRKLEEFVKGNPKAYELLVKELMKLESQLKQAELRKYDRPNDTNSQNVFVILKGLGDDIRYPVETGDESPLADMRSVAGILTPDGGEYEEPNINEH